MGKDDLIYFGQQTRCIKSIIPVQVSGGLRVLLYDVQVFHCHYTRQTKYLYTMQYLFHLVLVNHNYRCNKQYIVTQQDVQMCNDGARKL